MILSRETDSRSQSTITKCMQHPVFIVLYPSSEDKMLIEADNEELSPCYKIAESNSCRVRNTNTFIIGCTAKPTVFLNILQWCFLLLTQETNNRAYPGFGILSILWKSIEEL